MNILLVAGHGNGDNGACANGYKEAQLTREFAIKLERKLKGICNVTLYDINKNLYQYQKKHGQINFRCYDYVLEVHFNAGGGYGVEVLRHESSCAKSVDDAIAKAISEVGFRNRGVKLRNNLYNMNVCHKQRVDYSLLEVCFINSCSDMTKYISCIEEVVDAVYESIKKCFNLCEKEEINMDIDHAKEILKTKVGLTDKTISFLEMYRYGETLIIKIAKAVQ